MPAVFLKDQLNERAPRGFRRGLVLGPLRRKDSCGFGHTLDRLLVSPRAPRKNVMSFLQLAVAVYIADKTNLRAQAPDGWTRTLSISAPSGRSFLRARAELEGALRFLSGDEWKLDLREGNPGIKPQGIEDDFDPGAVCLFSGGLDSLTGAIDLLEEGTSVLLVSHFDSGFEGGVQQDLAAELQGEYGREAVRHRALQLYAPNKTESSTRSRSILFIALGMAVASSYADDMPLYIPENGFIGINIPLTGSRAGSYSTRTTHPYFLHQLGKALAHANIRHPLVNPLALASKGDALRSCANGRLLERLAPRTISCAHLTAGRWQGQPPGNCGYCYPCLIRRASLHKLGWDDAAEYANDAVGKAAMLDEEVRGRDLRALAHIVRGYRRGRRRALTDVLKSGQTGSAQIVSYAACAREGVAEVRQLFEDKGARRVRKFAGL